MEEAKHGFEIATFSPKDFFMPNHARAGQR